MRVTTLEAGKASLGALVGHYTGLTADQLRRDGASSIAWGSRVRTALCPVIGRWPGATNGHSSLRRSEGFGGSRLRFRLFTAGFAVRSTRLWARLLGLTRAYLHLPLNMPTMTTTEPTMKATMSKPTIASTSETTPSVTTMPPEPTASSKLCSSSTTANPSSKSDEEQYSSGSPDYRPATLSVPFLSEEEQADRYKHYSTENRYRGKRSLSRAFDVIGPPSKRFY